MQKPCPSPTQPINNVAYSEARVSLLPSLAKDIHSRRDRRFNYRPGRPRPISTARLGIPTRIEISSLPCTYTSTYIRIVSGDGCTPAAALRMLLLLLLHTRSSGVRAPRGRCARSYTVSYSRREKFRELSCI